MKVYKVADVVHRIVRFTGKGPFSVSDVAAPLTNLEPPNDPDPNTAWKLFITIGSGPAAREVELETVPLVSLSWPKDTPVFLKPSTLVYFRDRLFLPEHLHMSASEYEEVLLRVKKQVYDEESEIASLRAAVSNLEATIEYARSGQRREPIPEHVKLLVWARDGASCVLCGSQQNLQFDHIIPVAKGGSNSEANIQLLCQPCNLRKSDKIAL